MAADSSRRQLPVLAGLLVVLAAVVWWQFGSGSAATRPAANVAGARPPVRPGAKTEPSPAETISTGVQLARLGEPRPSPEEGGRDPFRAGAPAPATGSPGAPSTPPPTVATPIVPTAPAVPAGPPPPPPIAVKFIGIVSRADVGKVAVLTDGKNVYYGREGEIVDGRWRIVSIGVESLQIEYVDGRGRQTVRLTG
jgi:hypothetical protein